MYFKCKLCSLFQETKGLLSGKFLIPTPMSLHRKRHSLGSYLRFCSWLCNKQDILQHLNICIHLLLTLIQTRYEEEKTFEVGKSIHIFINLLLISDNLEAVHFYLSSYNPHVSVVTHSPTMESSFKQTCSRVFWFIYKNRQLNIAAQNTFEARITFFLGRVWCHSALVHAVKWNSISLHGLCNKFSSNLICI